MSLDEFLAWEPKQPLRYEFADGHVFAMAGASRAHGTIATNLVALVRPTLRGKGCAIYVSDMKVAVPEVPVVRYPDVVVTCDPRDLADEQLTRFPIFLVEIVSASTETLDRGGKFAEYRTISTVEEYVLIDSRTVHVEVFRRRDVTRWFFEEYGPGDQVVFESIDVRLPIESLYEDLTFKQRGPVLIE
jgi:Uma2 family endonuclease